LEPYRAYVEARLDVETGDPHLDATVLWRELRGLGFACSYPTLTRELRRLELRPVCTACQHRSAGELTVELDHPPGEELQLDWKELRETPWRAPAYALVGALAWSGTTRVVLCEAKTTPHLVDALERLLRSFGGTPTVWRVDHMEGAVEPASARLCRSFAEAAKHYGARVTICPAYRPQRKGVVEAAIRYLGRSWWRTAKVATLHEAQRSVEAWCVGVADQRRRRGQPISEQLAAERLRPLPRDAFVVEIRDARVASRAGLVSYEGNRYSVAPGQAGRRVEVRRLVGSGELGIYTDAGVLVALHRRALPGQAVTISDPQHRTALERAVLERFSTTKRCPRTTNRPPSDAALDAARSLAPRPVVTAPSIADYAALAGAVA
jgi:transposase